MSYLRYLPLPLAMFALLGCSSGAATKDAVAKPGKEEPAWPKGAVRVEEALKRAPDFGRYWYQGLAELSRYKLEQARYGENHPGEAVLIYVTEDFRGDKQIKYEGGERAGVFSALKLNAYRRFYTGVYPYTLMTSVYGPADGGAALKVVNTVQEWCGQTFTQLNRREGEVEGVLRSYFQSEGDQQLSLPASAMYEEDVWLKARIKPESLPVGELELIPAPHALRLQHQPMRSYKAMASVEVVAGSELGGQVEQLVYTVRYEGLARSLRLYVERAFPHGILAFEEATTSEIKQATPAQLTRARRTQVMLLDYWARHGAGDGAYREALGLEY